MSFTRFYDDECRIIKQNQQSTGPGRWILDVPGNGDKPSFMLDPHIIPQKWGGNLYTNSIDIQSALLGIDKKINRDCVNDKLYVKQDIKTNPITYPVNDSLTTEQSRAIMPAWTFRDLEQIDHYYLPINPQQHAIVKFKNNVSSRILEKDNFHRGYDSLPINNQPYELIAKPQGSSNQPFCTSEGTCEKIQ